MWFAVAHPNPYGLRILAYQIQKFALLISVYCCSLRNEVYIMNKNIFYSLLVSGLVILGTLITGCVKKDKKVNGKRCTKG